MRTGAFNWIILLTIALVSLSCYLAIGYFIPRPFFADLMLAVGVVFIVYVFSITKSFAEKNFAVLILFSLLFRLVFLIAIPQLSDDYFRFLWDGLLTNNGVNPYRYTPDAISLHDSSNWPGYMQSLRSNMNSPAYFSVYPPLLQGLFYLCARIGNEAIISFLIPLRLVTILAEAGTIYLGIKLLNHLKQPAYKILVYALNPLVIIELSGNLHGEAIMIFLIAASFFLLLKEKFVWSAVLLGLAVSAKLLPLLFLPALFFFLPPPKRWAYIGTTLITTVISFLPYLDGSVISHLTTSVGLYFNRFEFNASIYYLLLWIGYDITGVNIIIVLGKILPVLATLLIVMLTLRHRLSDLRQLLTLLLFTLLLYYLFSLVVHPWYITTLVFFCVFSGYRFPLTWSLLIMLTYSAYLQKPYQEILWLTAVEYILLSLFIFAEIRYRKLHSPKIF